MEENQSQEDIKTQELNRVRKNPYYENATSTAYRFGLRHVFRAGAVVWTKYKGEDYYMVFKSLTRPNRGTQVPGGRVERHENPAQAAVREVKEETGIDTHIVCPLAMAFFENPAGNHSNMQIYYILRPSKPVNVKKIWHFIDKDETKQKMECWFVKASEDPSFLSVGQNQIITIFQQWLAEHKKKK